MEWRVAVLVVTEGPMSAFYAMPNNLQSFSMSRVPL